MTLGSAVAPRRRPPRIMAALLLALKLAVALLLVGLVWGRFPEFYRDPVRDLGLVLALVPSVSVLATSGAGKGVRHHGERGYLVIVNTLWNVTLFAMIWMRGHGIGLLPGDGPLRIAGLVVLAAGAVIRSAAMLELGRRFSFHIAVQQEHTLRTTGLYARVRHPSYLGLILIVLGIALVLESQLGVGAIAVALLLMRGRMAREEKFLLDQFGEEYRVYMARTKRLVPWVY